jgi:MFS family permease
MNIGNAMFDTSSAWLMTSLNADAVAVSLVQVAASLPIVLFTLPAGALADLIDSRRFLIVAQTAVALVVAILAALVSAGLATPLALLLATFLLSAGLALSAPAWHSIAPLLVSRAQLDNAIAANGVGYNFSRAVGPALAGVVIAGLGIATPFWIDCAACLAALGALIWWRSPRDTVEGLRSERLIAAVSAGLRHAADSRRLRATLVRSVAFCLFASASWALLPLIARSQMAQGPACYGALLSAIGVGAVGGSLGLGWLRVRLAPDGVVILGTFGAALALVLFGLAHAPATAACASVVFGASSSLVLTSLHASAHSALPDRVRARGLAIFLTTIFGAVTVGSAVWGRVAGIEGLPVANFVAAAGAVLAVPLTRRWNLASGAGVECSDSEPGNRSQAQF